jgi:hypothetical protein
MMLFLRSGENGSAGKPGVIQFYRNDTREHCGVILHLQERGRRRTRSRGGHELRMAELLRKIGSVLLVGGFFFSCIGMDGWVGSPRREWRVSGNGMGCFFLTFDASVDRNRTMYEHIERLIF